MSLVKRIAVVILPLIFLIAGAQLFRLYRQPLGPALELSTPTEPVPTLTAFRWKRLHWPAQS
jgi:hypothetical protein